MSMPASLSAIRAAATIRWANRSMRRTSLRSMNWSASNPLTSHANVTPYWLASNCVIGAAPDLPATSASQVVSTSLPRGDRAPTPLITTLRRPLRLIEGSSHADAAVDEQHLAGDERGLVCAQEAYRPRDVPGVSEAAERRVREHRLAQRLREHLGERRVDVAGRDGVGADATAAELPRERLREADDAGL